MPSPLFERANHQCELCGSEHNLTDYEIPFSKGQQDAEILICDNCASQINNEAPMDINHWRCLNDSMWSPIPAVQVMAYRLLNRLKAEGWSQALLDMMYLEDDVRQWAESGIIEDDDSTLPTLDSNGNPLSEGDDVTIIKDLEVKGAGFTAKRGTLVKNIHLTDNPKHIEGKVNGTQVVLLSAFMKKA